MVSMSIVEQVFEFVKRELEFLLEGGAMGTFPLWLCYRVKTKLKRILPQLQVLYSSCCQNDALIEVTCYQDTTDLGLIFLRHPVPKRQK